SGTSFNFEISELEDFTNLSKALWEKNKDYFINTGNVEIPTRNNKKYSELKKNLRVDIDVEQEFRGSQMNF
ncbi:1649_t:CDS:2, partial [Funneliformis caledonium]